jgi:hypothetical protein
MLGIEWMRRQSNDGTYIRNNQGWPGVPQNLNFYNNIIFDNQCVVTVDLQDNAPALPPKTVVSQAVSGSESVRLAWDVNANPGTDGGDGFPVLTLSNWRILH